MIQLSDEQINQKINFIDNYISASNAAQGSSFDANANVDTKNIATLESEIHKDINIQVNRRLVKNEIESLFDTELSNEYIRQLEAHEIYTR